MQLAIRDFGPAHLSVEVRRKAVTKFAQGAGPRLVAHELDISIAEAAAIQADMSGQRRTPTTTRRRSQPRRR